MKWTRLSCCSFAANAVRLQLHALAYNLANFVRTLALPVTGAHWSLTSLREKLVKIGAKIVTHARYVTFQMAEVAVPSQLFEEILRQDFSDASQNSALQNSEKSGNNRAETCARFIGLSCARFRKQSRTQMRHSPL